MDRKTLRMIYDRTGGYCHLCNKKLSFSNFGKTGRRGAWHRDHSVARARGGSDRLSNLVAACITCNCSKQDRPTRSFRAANGFTVRPPSRGAIRLVRRTRKGAVLGSLAGFVFGGPAGFLPGLLVGTFLSRVTA